MLPDISSTRMVTCLLGVALAACGRRLAARAGAASASVVVSVIATRPAVISASAPNARQDCLGRTRDPLMRSPLHQRATPAAPRGPTALPPLWGEGALPPRGHSRSHPRRRTVERARWRTDNLAHVRPIRREGCTVFC